ncbi:hypothetical protein [Candidatus Accumulibacter vicinus]|uniref:Uncharacterized protein n=1 Tax=Candidatus Accumulibacter vicinus TaxID=2954382 RepID=A0A084Y2D0_9PROT|nr:hypothetical protein [Candidatus Accumulibacter vicinus]KFB68874.1 MAG: hypothetical protein CAPSK01_001729 [Candidatus Accumulibacter vicinus]
MQLSKEEIEQLETKVRAAAQQAIAYPTDALPDGMRTLVDMQLGTYHTYTHVAALTLLHLARLATAVESLAKTLNGTAASEQIDWDTRTPPQAVEVHLDPPVIDPANSVVDPDHYA